MQVRFCAIFSTALLTSALVVGCDRSSSPEIETPDQAQPQAQEEYVPDPISDWGDGTIRGMVRLEWGAAPPEGATIELRLWKGGDVIGQHDIPATGPGPWAFEFKADDTSGFEPGDTFGIGAMLVVPPDGEAWYMGNPPTVQIWKYGAEDGPIEVPIIPIDQRVTGDGPPAE